MGDAADCVIEEGMDAYNKHLAGTCDSDDPCQYCADDLEEILQLGEKKGKD